MEFSIYYMKTSGQDRFFFLKRVTGHAFFDSLFRNFHNQTNTTYYCYCIAKRKYDERFCPSSNKNASAESQMLRSAHSQFSRIFLFQHNQITVILCRNIKNSSNSISKYLLHTYNFLTKQNFCRLTRFFLKPKFIMKFNKTNNIIMCCSQL